MILLKDRKTRQLIVIALILLLGGAWRIYDCYKLDIGTDDASSLHTAQGSLASTWKKAVNYQIQPPVYFLLLNVWTRISPTLEFARLLSVLFSLLSVFFIYRIWKYLFGDEFYWVAPAMMMAHSFHLWTALEVRGFAAVILFTTASTYYFIRIFIRKDHQAPFRLDMVFYLLWSILGIFTHYYVGFLLLGHFLVSLFWFEKRAFLRLLACYFVIGFVLLLWLPVLQMQLSLRPEEDPGNWPTMIKSSSPILSHLAFLMMPIYWIAKFIIYFPISSAASKVSVFTFFVLGVVALIAVRFTSRAEKLTREEKAFLILALTTLTSLTALYLFSANFVAIKYYCIPLSSVILLISVVCYNIKKMNLKIISISAILLAFVSFSVFHQMKFSKGKWKALSGYVELHEKGGDLILFFNAVHYKLQFGYHYRGLNSPHDVPNDLNYEKYTYRERIIQSEEQLIDFFKNSRSATGRIWLIGRDDIFSPLPGGLDLNGRILKKYLDEWFDLVENKKFENTAVVRLFVRKNSRPSEQEGS